MAKIEDLINISAGSVDVDWSMAESRLGFNLHNGLKDFYSRIVGKRVNDMVDFREEKFLEKTGDERNDTWFSFNECEGRTQFELDILKSVDNAANQIVNAFEMWTGGNEFGHRAMIGQFFMNIGEILILFNNDTGAVEWIDCGYGYFDVYEENPNGILAYSMQEFLEKFK